MANQTPTTHPTPGPIHPGDASAPPAPATATPKPPPTPLDPPVMYANIKWKVPGVLASTQEQADALDPSEWVKTTSTVDTGASGKSAAPKPQYPQLYANVNLPPKIVGNADDAKALGEEWKQFDLPEALVKAAQANIDAQKQSQSASGQQQSGSGHQSGQQQHKGA